MENSTSRREFLKTSLIIGSAISTVSKTLYSKSNRTKKLRPAPKEKPKRPNILWIVGENLNLDLGIYGAKNV